VSNGGLNSYEEMPGAVIIDPPRPRRPRPVEQPTGGTGGHHGVRVNQRARLVARIALLFLAAAVERN
jgi:hypothetical protein